MCGIAGWLDRDINLLDKMQVLNNMSDSLKSRGPDERGEFITHNCALLHRRLSIIDIENGKQPMCKERGENKFILVYNGELYNTDEVRNELFKLGYNFSGHSDTEVVLTAYLEWGEKCAVKFNGIFAFAIYNTAEKSLFLCRDRIGVKPLFYYISENRLIFASEIKAILKSGVVPPEVDETGLYELFFISPARTPGITAFKYIEELKPGECATYSSGVFKKKKYYNITAAEHTDNEEQTIEKVRFLITDAIERQLTSDVGACCFLSGGLDSSIITKVTSDYYKSNNLGTLSTYSVDYKDNSRYFKKSLFQPNSDVDFISQMSRFADTKHTEIVLDNISVANALRDAVTARDLPAMADIDSSLLLFCREVKHDFKVSLSGECADEIFAGYPWYHNEEMMADECFPWSRTQQVRRDILKPGLLLHGEEYVANRYRQTIAQTEYLPSDSKKDRRMREMFLLNFNWFMQCLLDRKDRCSMFSGLEVRVPFCDYRIVDYAYNMPWNIKAFAGREKGIVRKAFEDILPSDITWRKKSPYPKTHNPIYFREVSTRVLDILDSNCVINEFLDKDNVIKIINEPDSIKSPWYGQLMQAPQILAYIIQLDFWIQEYKIEFKNIN